MGVVLVGTFMVILDTTVVNVALPSIAHELGVTGGIEWIASAYLLAVGLVQLATGWLSDRLGKKLTFTWSLTLFTGGSLLAALAPSLEWLVAFRILQGIGGGAMMPVGMAMIFELFPAHRRGTALGIWGIAAMSAPAIGPVLGGFLATAGSWRWVFAVNAPIGVAGIILARKLLRDIGFREHRPLPWRNLMVAAGALVALLAAFDRAAEWGWLSLGFITLGGFGVLAVVVFVRLELSSRSPLLEMRMFAVPTFAITCGIVWLATSAQFARLVLIPLELQSVRAMTALEVGVVLTPAAFGAAITMPIGGRLVDRIGARVPAVCGLTLIGIAVWMLAHLSAHTSLERIAGIMAIQGLGMGLAMMPSTVAAMNALPAAWVARGAAVRSLNQQIAAAMGVAILASVVVGQIGSMSAPAGVSVAAIQQAYDDAFLVAFVGVAIAVVLAMWLPGAAETRRRQAERAREHLSIEGSLA